MRKSWVKKDEDPPWCLDQLVGKSLRILDSSAAFVLQHVESLLVLGLESHDIVVGGDLPSAVLVYVAHEDVVQASSDERALLAQDDDLGAHRLASLLDGQITLFVDADDGNGGIYASSSCHCTDDCPCYYCHHIHKAFF